MQFWFPEKQNFLPPGNLFFQTKQASMKIHPSHTKIVATLGPASSSKEVLKQMIEKGVDVFRLNFSHSKQEEHLKLINLIK